MQNGLFVVYTLLYPYQYYLVLKNSSEELFRSKFCINLPCFIIELYCSLMCLNMINTESMKWKSTNTLF